IRKQKEVIMKKPLFVLAVFATLSALSGLSHAQETVRVLSTKELMEICKLPASPESRSFCVGYTTAIYDTYLVTRHPQRAKPFVCIKQPAPSRDQVIGDFVKFAQANTMLMDKPAAGTFLGFLAEHFPCSKK
ncbi:Rap1a/Tai family immunity protein, partial [Mesorhizobium japonicum]|uniref:Rap1a/Tai family immunity protein n=1 Tax=Mesorhizobium japonicum TaxID=2066070 RepID=UPI003B5C18CB